MAVFGAIKLRWTRWLLGMMDIPRRWLIPIARTLAAFFRIDKPYNLMMGDVEAPLRHFHHTMTISKALREAPSQHAVLKEISEIGVIPAAFLQNGPDALVAAGFWGLMRESFDADGQIPRDVLEVLASELSDWIGSDITVSAHAAFLDGMGFTQAAAYFNQPEGLRSKDSLELRHRVAVEWLSACRSGHHDGSFLEPLSGPQRAEILGTALAFHYLGGAYPALLSETGYTELVMACFGLNRWVCSPRLRAAVYRGSTTWIGYHMGKRRPQGTTVSLEILKQSDLDLALPKDLDWAEPNPFIATTAAGFLRATERLAHAHYTKDLLTLIQSQIETHDPWIDPSEKDPSWPKDPISEAQLESELDSRIVAIGLLTALAPKRLREPHGEQLLKDFVHLHPWKDENHCDAALLALFSWSRAQAGRRFVAKLAAMNLN